MNQGHILVMKTCSSMRAQSRKWLAGNWKNAILITVIYYLVTTGVGEVFSFVIGKGGGSTAASLINLVYTLLVAGPMAYGYVKCIKKIAKGGNAEFADLFCGFEQFGRFFVANLLIAIFIILWSLLLIVPGIIASLAYAMVFFLMSDDEHLGGSDAIRLSKERMRGNKGKLFLLSLSFIGWMIIPIIASMYFSISMVNATMEFYGIYGYNAQATVDTTGYQIGMDIVIFVASAFLMPYIYMSYLAFYNELMGIDNQLEEAAESQSQNTSEEQAQIEEPEPTAETIQQESENPPAAPEDETPKDQTEV